MSGFESTFPATVINGLFLAMSFFKKEQNDHLHKSPNPYKSKPNTK
ncbi:hypothetical protein LEP1GSC123_2142 [Leptospira borgpetersenii str. 200701203]|uniref:Uncharacterized protein n=1 Tax=Leptospira borgpetersenii str. 200701203 TaxID=1193007 RepID=M3GFA9_LEPBO|nr:hypothetical protein LEP1GSC123_2142 [Leptospira borgpetersenii str. 200701203]